MRTLIRTAGRFLLSGIFVYSGYGMFKNAEGYCEAGVSRAADAARGSDDRQGSRGDHDGGRNDVRARHPAEDVGPHSRAHADPEHHRRPPFLEAGEARGSARHSWFISSRTWGCSAVCSTRARTSGPRPNPRTDSALLRFVKAREVGAGAPPASRAAAARRAHARRGCRAPSTAGVPPAVGYSAVVIGTTSVVSRRARMVATARPYQVVIPLLVR